MDNKQNKGGAMDAISLPQHIIDLERHAQSVQYGEVGPFYIVRSNGESVGLRGQKTQEIRFKNSDEALLYILDQVKGLPTDKSGRINLSIEFINGVVKKISNTTDMTTKYHKGE